MAYCKAPLRYVGRLLLSFIHRSGDTVRLLLGEPEIDQGRWVCALRRRWWTKNQESWKEMAKVKVAASFCRRSLTRLVSRGVLEHRVASHKIIGEEVGRLLVLLARGNRSGREWREIITKLCSVSRREFNYKLLVQCLRTLLDSRPFLWIEESVVQCSRCRMAGIVFGRVIVLEILLQIRCYCTGITLLLFCSLRTCWYLARQSSRESRK